MAPVGPQITIVVPCYNEAKRLAVERFQAFVREQPEVAFLFVDDGSTDRTAEVIGGLIAADPAHFALHPQPRNGGKAEAVRAGVLRALADRPRYVGYWDADLATPLAEIPRFIDVLDSRLEREICFGSRVRLLGRSIDRRAARHYLGRLFATVASYVLDLAVYDTQCGAKMFRVSEQTAELFHEPFCVNWTFDVEIIARVQSRRALSEEDSCIYELPLNEWRDVAGSKVRPTDFIRGIVEMLRIYTKYGRGGRRLRLQRGP